MSEDAHISGLQEEVILKTKSDILRAAALEKDGTIKLVRYDREEGRMVVDVITHDMPPCELIL